MNQIPAFKKPNISITNNEVFFFFQITTPIVVQVLIDNRAIKQKIVILHSYDCKSSFRGFASSWVQPMFSFCRFTYFMPASPDKLQTLKAIPISADLFPISLHSASASKGHDISLLIKWKNEILGIYLSLLTLACSRSFTLVLPYFYSPQNW